MTNERLVEIKTPMYMDAGTVTLDEFIRLAKRQFSERVIALYEIAEDTNVRDFATKEDQLEYEDTKKSIGKSL